MKENKIAYKAKHYQITNQLMKDGEDLSSKIDDLEEHLNYSKSVGLRELLSEHWVLSSRALMKAYEEFHYPDVSELISFQEIQSVMSEEEFVYLVDNGYLIPMSNPLEDLMTEILMRSDIFEWLICEPQEKILAKFNEVRNFIHSPKCKDESHIRDENLAFLENCEWALKYIGPINNYWVIKTREEYETRRDY